MLSKKALERLSMLAIFMRDLKVGGSGPDSKHFNMGLWCDETENGVHACALGWACRMPEFNEQGLSLKTFQAVKGIVSFSVERSPVYVDAGKEFLGGYQAAMAFFDLNVEQVRVLFSTIAAPGYGIDTPRQWAAPCMNMMREWSPEYRAFMDNVIEADVGFSHDEKNIAARA